MVSTKKHGDLLKKIQQFMVMVWFGYGNGLRMLGC